ncbi:MAG TPA: aldo/keto reductase [Anaerolineae bacterium]|nr:aldo/keto reductase [Anaerolineae bacterium]
MSTVVIFGAFALGQVAQKEADAVMEVVLEHGVNHIDIAPSYFDAELRLGPWLENHRDQFFLGCKTQLRQKSLARDDCSAPQKLDTYDSSCRIVQEGGIPCQGVARSNPSSRPELCWRI